MKLKLKSAILALVALALDPIRRYHESALTLYAYSGSTASSSLANPPAAVSQPLTRGSTTYGANKPSLWLYQSTNLTTDLVAANFFTDGYYLGMRPGDIVIGTQYTSLGSSAISFLGSISAVTTSGALFTTGSLMTSTGM